MGRNIARPCVKMTSEIVVAEKLNQTKNCRDPVAAVVAVSTLILESFRFVYDFDFLALESVTLTTRFERKRFCMLLSIIWAYQIVVLVIEVVPVVKSKGHGQGLHLPYYFVWQSKYFLRASSSIWPAHLALGTPLFRTLSLVFGCRLLNNTVVISMSLLFTVCKTLRCTDLSYLTYLNWL